MESKARGILAPHERLVLVTGGFGSGKTEVSVNLSLLLADAGREVRIVDLDVVNPYFRCREARGLMERHGIRVLAPPGAQVLADLPIVLREVRAALDPPAGAVTIVDVGGDEAGARTLGSFRASVDDGRYELWQVINSRRPFTGGAEDCLKMCRALARASRFRVTGLLANSHLLEETSPDTVLEGWELAREVSRRSGLPVRAVAVMERLAGRPELDVIDVPLLPLRRHMAPPWQPAESPDDHDTVPPRPEPGNARFAPAG
jgi:hypothetical protein